MENLTYVTSNYGKYIAVKEKLENNGIDINYFKCDLAEPDVNNVAFISKEKARIAFSILNSPVFVMDSGFYIENYPNNPGYPGAFVKRSGVSSNILELLNVMKNVKNRNCYFKDCLTFFDGNNYYQFFGIMNGSLSYEIRGNENKRAMSNLWYIFIPENSTKTLLEMTDLERNNQLDSSVSATNEFIKWYNLNYRDAKTLKKVR